MSRTGFSGYSEMANLSVCAAAMRSLSLPFRNRSKASIWVGVSLRGEAEISPGGIASDEDDEDAAMGRDLVDFEVARPRNTLAMPLLRDESVAGMSSPGKRDMCSLGSWRSRDQ